MTSAGEEEASADEFARTGGRREERTRLADAGPVRRDW